MKKTPIHCQLSYRWLYLSLYFLLALVYCEYAFEGYPVKSISPE